jgi:hypothetical protein
LTPVTLTFQDVKVPLPTNVVGVTTITPVDGLYETTSPIM